MTKAQVRTIDSRDVREFISKLLRWPTMPEKQLSHNSLSAIDSKKKRNVMFGMERQFARSARSE